MIAFAFKLADAVGMIFLRGSSRLGIGSVLLVLALFGGISVSAVGQIGATAGQDVTQRPTSTPYNGDLSIFEYPDRDKKLQIDRVMDLLGIVRGKNVADIGAGSGWFTVRAARRVGPAGAVIAEDINPLAIEYIGKKVMKENLTNVRTVLGSANDPRLPGGSVDAVLMLKVYHEIAHPVPTLKVLKKSTAPGGKGGNH